MAERASAIAHLRSPSDGNGRVKLSERRPGSILQVAAWPDTDERVRAIVAELLHVTAPKTGSAIFRDGVSVAALAPGRYLISAAGDDLAPRLEAAIASADGAVTDIAHGRTILRLDGEMATSVLAKGVAIDLDLAAFPPGRVVQTMIHHVDVVIHRLTESAYELWALRSFGESLAEWLLDAGLEFGIAFRMGETPGGHSA